ncbi:MAG: hypothetical protein WD757_02135 [Actinomycetota bacterium]
MSENPSDYPTGDLSVESQDQPDSAQQLPARGSSPGTTNWRVVASKLLHFVAAIFLFVLAIQLMKKGAAPVGARLKTTLFFDNAVSTLGLGWLGAYFVLAGSPVAAISLSFFNAHALTSLQTFTMLSGSRLGASFIVLLVGFLYSIRNKDRKRTIGMGVLALSMTAIVYIPGMLVGYGVLKSGLLTGINWRASNGVSGVIDFVWGPVVDFATRSASAPVLFLIGLGTILLAFKLLDRVLPDLDHERQAQARGHWLKKPWPMFFLGSLAALLTLSVAVALTALVPLAAKGHVTRREAIPYIMGANITTLADTLVAAMLLDRALGVQIVLAEAIAVALITVFYLAFFYKSISRAIIALDDWVVQTNKRLWGFVVGLFLVPVVLIAIGTVIGPLVA